MAQLDNPNLSESQTGEPASRVTEDNGLLGDGFFSNAYTYQLAEGEITQITYTPLSDTPSQLRLKLPTEPIWNGVLDRNNRYKRFKLPANDNILFEVQGFSGGRPAFAYTMDVAQPAIQYTPDGGTIVRYIYTLVGEITIQYGDLRAPAPVTRSEIAYAANDNPQNGDEKTIPIPEGYSYISHTSHITTANPQGESSERWERHIFVDQYNGRITAVRVQVKAGSKDTWGTSIWIGVQLDVTMQPPL